jgi:hypothetical protein
MTLSGLITIILALRGIAWAAILAVTNHYKVEVDTTTKRAIENCKEQLQEPSRIICTSEDRANIAPIELIEKFIELLPSYHLVVAPNINWISSLSLCQRTPGWGVCGSRSVYHLRRPILLAFTSTADKC